MGIINPLNLERVLSLKIISFAVPCYNSAQYMRKCIDSLLVAGDDAEILIVDDGSTKDETADIADEYEKNYPGICRAIHQENGGHGEAVNAGLRNATGMYYKVVDSDDWLDKDSLLEVIDKLKRFRANRQRVDMLICNYVYEHVEDGTSHTVRYTNALPQNKIFGWSSVRHFRPDQNLLMHSVIFRTKVLRDSGLCLPKHTFYVDNLFVYVPLPYVKTMYYMDIDLYRYYIGRADQSVNEQVMIGRIDQQIYVNNLMINAYSLPGDVKNRRLSKYMMKYLAMICCVTSIMLVISGTEENREKLRKLWSDFKARDPKMFWHIRLGVRGVISNPRGRFAELAVVRGYHLAQKIFKFN